MKQSSSHLILLAFAWLSAQAAHAVQGLGCERIHHDAKTGLTWMNCSISGGFDTGECYNASPYPWQHVLQGITEHNNRSDFGYNDWRLPYRDEIASSPADYCRPALGKSDQIWFMVDPSESSVPKIAWYIGPKVGYVATENATGFAPAFLVRGKRENPLAVVDHSETVDSNSQETSSAQPNR